MRAGAKRVEGAEAEGGTATVSVLVFTYNSADVVRTTLEHLARARAASRTVLEVVVVDNDSTDGTAAMVLSHAAELGLEVDVVSNPVRGLKHSRMVGVKRARGDYVLLVDDDNWLPEDWFPKLERVIREERPDVIGSCSEAVSSVPIPAWWRRVQGTFACGCRYPESGLVKDPLAKFWGAGLTVRRQLLDEALHRLPLRCGGRQGQLLTAGDDTELCYRMRLMGASFYHAAELRLSHFMRPRRLRRETLRGHHRGNALALIDLEIYKWPLTRKVLYRLPLLAAVMLLASPLLTLRFRFNYLPLAWRRLLTLRERARFQDKVVEAFGKA